MDRSGVYENVVEATKATLRQALNDAPAFTNQVSEYQRRNLAVLYSAAQQ